MGSLLQKTTHPTDVGTLQWQSNHFKAVSYTHLANRYYLYQGFVRMNLGIDGLFKIIRSEMKDLSPVSGDIDVYKRQAFWMGVLTDLKARGVEDILITVTDNLNGFTETIKSVFPTSTTVSYTHLSPFLIQDLNYLQNHPILFSYICLLHHYLSYKYMENI